MATIPKEGALNFTSHNRLWNSLLPYDTLTGNTTWLAGSMYEEVMQSGKTLIIEDLRKQKKHPAVQVFLKAGYFNLILTPILYDGS
jgi:hypothetical protein